MGDRWLFRVDVATERETDDMEKTRGLGHAIKCLSVANEIAARGGCIHFSVEGACDVGPFFERAGVTYDITTDHQTVIDEFSPTVIVTDVNYLDTHEMEEYRESAIVVNIAPRGKCKYHADLSFTSAQIFDVPAPPEAPLEHWYAGPEYAILNERFVNYRRDFEPDGPAVERNGIVVQMGGVDRFNMTGTVLSLMDAAGFDERVVTVIAGPFNPHVDDLRKKSKSMQFVDLVVHPRNLAEIVATHEIGVFGTGISTYEALAIGVPSVNFGHSRFHDMRGEILESEGLSRYLGRYDCVNRKSFSDTLLSLLDRTDELSEMRARGLASVDGRAPKRIVDTVQTHGT